MKISVKRRCFIYCYRLLFLPIFAVLLPYYLYRMWKRGGYGPHFLHRFGFVPKNKSLIQKTIWLQAVSVGEMEALQPLLEALKANGVGVYLTTTTSTGFQIAQNKYKNLVNTIAYFPLDFCLFSWIAWRRIRPQYAFLMESELWPEHLWQAYRNKIPVFLLNGRCSDKTFARYSCFETISGVLFSFIHKIYAASDLDGQRFQSLTSVPVETVGNLKVDAALGRMGDDVTPIKLSDLGSEWENSFVLLGASTWPGEEEMLLNVFTEAKKTCPQLRLILVPRHAERASDLEKILSPYDFCFRTNPKLNSEVYVVNTTGELRHFLQLAQFVFVGKSLDPHRGGQTPIEAAALGKPIVYGPHMENFRVVCKRLEACGGAVRCSDEKEVCRQLLRWIAEPQSAESYAKAAQRWTISNRGATERILAGLRQLGLV